MGIWTTPTYIQGYPRYWDFYPNQDDSSVLNGIWDILLLCAHCGYSHKIIAIFPLYEFGVMAYDVAIISCIVAALERYMSHPWLIEKIQILVWHKHLHRSLIDDLTISLYGYRIRYLVEIFGYLFLSLKTTQFFIACTLALITVSWCIEVIL